MTSLDKRSLFIRAPLGAPLSLQHKELVQRGVDLTNHELTVLLALDDTTAGGGWEQMQHLVAEIYAAAAGRALQIQSMAAVDVVPLDFCAYTADDLRPFMSRPPDYLPGDRDAFTQWWIGPELVESEDPGREYWQPLPASGKEYSSSPQLLWRHTRTLAPWRSFPHVAVGGTFDHLHAGHKILLTATALAATKRIVCGISTDALLQKKKHRELLEPYRQRELNVLLFLRKIRKDLIVELVPISDPYGPTASDPSIGALVVSQETLGGSSALNVRRSENGLLPMCLLPVDLLAASDAADAMVSQVDTGLKISSTAIRAALAKRQQQREFCPPH
ncbi:hypothetical protein GGF46_004411 [Coemansia sp. RSA 552]|nr:hypothetical protein GGF46_004411 [Coemansia sp. RSA 552]